MGGCAQSKQVEWVIPASQGQHYQQQQGEVPIRARLVQTKQKQHRKRFLRMRNAVSKDSVASTRNPKMISIFTPQHGTKNETTPGTVIHDTRKQSSSQSSLGHPPLQRRRKQRRRLMHQNRDDHGKSHETASSNSSISSSRTTSTAPSTTTSDFSVVASNTHRRVVHSEEAVADAPSSLRYCPQTQEATRKSQDLSAPLNPSGFQQKTGTTVTHPPPACVVTEPTRSFERPEAFDYGCAPLELMMQTLANLSFPFLLTTAPSAIEGRQQDKAMSTSEAQPGYDMNPPQPTTANTQNDDNQGATVENPTESPHSSWQTSETEQLRALLLETSAALAEAREQQVPVEQITVRKEIPKYGPQQEHLQQQPNLPHEQRQLLEDEPHVQLFQRIESPSTIASAPSDETFNGQITAAEWASQKRPGYYLVLQNTQRGGRLKAVFARERAPRNSVGFWCAQRQDNVEIIHHSKLFEDTVGCDVNDDKYCTGWKVFLKMAALGKGSAIQFTPANVSLRKTIFVYGCNGEHKIRLYLERALVDVSGYQSFEVTNEELYSSLETAIMSSQTGLVSSPSTTFEKTSGEGDDESSSAKGNLTTVQPIQIPFASHDHGTKYGVPKVATARTESNSSFEDSTRGRLIGESSCTGCDLQPESQPTSTVDAEEIIAVDTQGKALAVECTSLSNSISDNCSASTVVVEINTAEPVDLFTASIEESITEGKLSPSPVKLSNDSATILVEQINTVVTVDSVAVSSKKAMNESIFASSSASLDNNFASTLDEEINTNNASVEDDKSEGTQTSSQVGLYNDSASLLVEEINTVEMAEMLAAPVEDAMTDGDQSCIPSGLDNPSDSNAVEQINLAGTGDFLTLPQEEALATDSTSFPLGLYNDSVTILSEEIKPAKTVDLLAIQLEEEMAEGTLAANPYLVAITGTDVEEVEEKGSLDQSAICGASASCSATSESPSPSNAFRDTVKKWLSRSKTSFERKQIEYGTTSIDESRDLLSLAEEHAGRPSFDGCIRTSGSSVIDIDYAPEEKVDPPDALKFVAASMDLATTAGSLNFNPLFEETSSHREQNPPKKSEYGFDNSVTQENTSSEFRERVSSWLSKQTIEHNQAENITETADESRQSWSQSQECSNEEDQGRTSPDSESPSAVIDDAIKQAAQNALVQARNTNEETNVAKKVVKVVTFEKGSTTAAAWASEHGRPGYYLIFEKRQGGRLKIKSGDHRVPRNAVGFWGPASVSSARRHHRCEVIKQSVGCLHDRGKYFDGWRKFIEIARRRNGAVVSFASKQSIPMDVYGFEPTKQLPTPLNIEEGLVNVGAFHSVIVTFQGDETPTCCEEQTLSVQSSKRAVLANQSSQVSKHVGSYFCAFSCFNRVDGYCSDLSTGIDDVEGNESPDVFRPNVDALRSIDYDDNETEDSTVLSMDSTILSNDSTILSNDSSIFSGDGTILTKDSLDLMVGAEDISEMAWCCVTR